MYDKKLLLKRKIKKDIVDWMTVINRGLQ